MLHKKEISIIATLGPSSFSEAVLRKLDHSGVDYVRINLSHTNIEDLRSTIDLIRNHVSAPLFLDTEGSQVRTGVVATGKVKLTAGKQISVGAVEIPGTEQYLMLRPPEVLSHLKEGDLLFIDFDTAVLRVQSVAELGAKGTVQCVVVTGGVIGSNKAVTVDGQNFSLPSLSEKDLAAIEIAKSEGITSFTLSFVDCREDVLEFRNLYPAALVISKIETSRGVDNLQEIIEVSDGILIDRGDLSREVALEKLPIAQKIIIRKTKLSGKPTFVATNLLDTMMHSKKPSRAEVNDIVNTLLDGAEGLVLAAETAIGEHPIETISFVRGLSNHIAPLREVRDGGAQAEKHFLQALDNSRYITKQSSGSCLVPPHGGRLINRVLRHAPDPEVLAGAYTLNVDLESAMDVEQIALGGFSPLEGFMTEAAFRSVMNTMRLPSGFVWTLPMLLRVSAEQASEINQHEQIVLQLADSNLPFALLRVEDIFRLAKDEACQKFYGTTDRAHPGVRAMLDGADYAVGGVVDLFSRIPAEFKYYQFTPSETRKVFESKGWSRVVGFHTRNAVHRSHEFAQMRALELGGCDGMLLHPVVGKKKQGDFLAEVIIRSYEVMIERVYSPERALLATFATYSRYMGPREAVFTALCRQNYGCSHFIVGRDHTGVGNFYAPDASHKIFDQFDDLQVEAIRIGDVLYNPTIEDYIERPIGSPTLDQALSISGTQVREMISRGEAPPTWFMRPEVSEAILSFRKSGRPIFVE